MRRASPPLAALVLLAAALPAHAYTVEPGDTLSGIAARNGVTVDEIADANGIGDVDRIGMGDTLKIAGRGGGSVASHTVTAGQTLSGLAAGYGVSVDALSEANGIADRGLIVVGQVLAVPGGSGSDGTSGSGGDGSDGAGTGRGGSGEGRAGVAASRDEVRSLIVEAARSYGWDPAVPLGLAMHESGWSNTVVSPDGARGIMQVLPATGDWVSMFLLDRDVDLAMPTDNVAAGMAYLDHLHGLYDGDVELALAAYYGGPGKVAGDDVPAFGRRYVANVLALAERYR